MPSPSTNRGTLRHSLSLSGKELSNADSLSLGEAIAEDSTITHISLADCVVSSAGLSSILAGIRRNVSIVEVDLKGVQLSYEKSILVASLLQQNHTIKHISLEWTSVGETTAGLLAIADAIALSLTIESVDLRACRLEPDSAAAIVKMCECKSLVKLDLRWNAIGADGGPVLACGIASSMSLLYVELDGNDIDEESMETINESLSRNLQRKSGLSSFGKSLLDYEDELDTIKSVHASQMAEMRASQIIEAEKHNSDIIQMTRSLENMKSVIECVGLEKDDAERKARLTELRAEELEITSGVLQAEMASLHSRVTSSETRHEREIEALRRDMAAKVAESKTIEEDLRRRLVQSLSKQETLARELSGVKEEFAVEKRDHCVTNERLSNTEHELSVSQAEYKSIQLLLEETQLSQRKVEKSLTSKEVALAELQGRHSHVSEELKQSMEEISQLKATLSRTSTSLEHTDRDLRKSQEKLNTTSFERDSLKNKLELEEQRSRTREREHEVEMSRIRERERDLELELERIRSILHKNEEELQKERETLSSTERELTLTNGELSKIKKLVSIFIGKEEALLSVLKSDCE
ncbi:hypothetical protein ADUPG1_012679 [Aduncisulcus paluster]|uniref:Uncharacterized protein n=1 Tax=Aduncisulcus paluster TaxID=2918883 RepID=A0ABQ5K3I1_9EUKA|nr:hypothetical protein ADUPG1_012679 [Aduncisulcus paluster]